MNAARPLSPRQQQVLDFIRSEIERQGFPPTMREIGEHLGIVSTNGVNDHLGYLERKGFIKRSALHSRGICLVGESATAGSNAAPSDVVREIKVLGKIQLWDFYDQANVVDVIKVDRRIIGSHREVFGYRVPGQSMIRAGIIPGDYALVSRQLRETRLSSHCGDIVLAQVGDTAVLAYFGIEDGYVRLRPANQDQPSVLVLASDWKPSMLVGKVIGMWRRFPS